MTTDTDEFRYLPGQAQALGVSAPPVKRLTLVLPDGRELSALQFGDGPPTVTLLHGAGLNAHTWDTTALLMQQPAIAIDLPGHGDSSWRGDADYSPHKLALDVATAMDRFTPGPQVMVGHSLGGLTAAAIAAARPDLVHELVIVDITPGIDTNAGPSTLREFFAGPTDFASREELVDRALAFGLGGSRADTERGVFFNTRVRPDGRIEWKHHFAHLAAQALDAHAPGAPGTPSPLAQTGWEDLARIHAPVTLVRASGGFVTIADADEFTRRVPHARVTTIEATHNVQETAPHALATLVRNATPHPEAGNVTSRSDVAFRQIPSP